MVTEATGDFKDKQFAKDEVASKVVEQYDEAQARVFYKYVMGGGGMDIHYGIYTKESDNVYESSKATNDRLITTMDWTNPITKDSVVLDLGSGHGGLSHEIAKKFGCRVVGANISPNQNDMNLAEAKVLGVDELIEVMLLDFNEGLPEEWTNKFTHVISCEVLCHAADKAVIFKEIMRVMKDGAAFTFTDIMGAEEADEKVLKDFTDRNATTKMARPNEYVTLMKKSGFKNASFLDFSHHLVYYFTNMRDQVTEHREDMIKEGCLPAYLDNWQKSLSSRVEIQKEHRVFAWGFFSCRKEGPAY